MNKLERKDYNEGLMQKINNSLYICIDETKLVIVHRREELTLITPADKDYIRKQNYIDIHMGIIVIRILSQVKEGLDSKALLCLYDSRFYDYEQFQIASVK